MFIVELFVLLLFLSAVSGTFAQAMGVLGRLYRNRGNWGRLRRIDYLILFLAFIGIICIIHGFFEPYELEQTTLRLSSNKILKNTKVKIALISDLHCDGHLRAEEKVVAAIKQSEPDLIFFTGDATNGREGLDQFRKTMTHLSAIAPVYACDGNHDAYSEMSSNDRYAGTGVKFLNCSASVVSIKKNILWIGGVSVDNITCLEHTLETSPPDSFRAFLFHYPEGIQAASKHGVDLFCAGHTHGGQVRIPIYGALITMAQSGKQFEWGHYILGKTHAYINRGIGMTALPVRFLAAPELTIIEIEGTG